MNKLKQQLHLILDEPRNATGLGKFIAFLLFVLIILNTLLIFVVYDDTIYTDDNIYIFCFDVFSAAVFAIEYLARIWIAPLKFTTCKSPIRARMRYVFSGMGIIDLLSFLPLILVGIGLIPYSMISSFRILKVLRLLKLSRYLMGWQLIARVFKNHAREIIASFMLLLVFSLTSSALMCQFEQPVQPEAFRNMFTGLYWAMSTITSTGYGDLVPVTSAGRFVGFLTMIFSIAIVAVPAGIFSAGFITEFRKENRDADELDINTFYITGSDNEIIIDEEAVERHQESSVIIEPHEEHKEHHHENHIEHYEGYPDYAYCPHCGKPLPHYKEFDSENLDEYNTEKN